MKCMGGATNSVRAWLNAGCTTCWKSTAPNPDGLHGPLRRCSPDKRPTSRAGRTRRGNEGVLRGRNSTSRTPTGEVGMDHPQAKKHPVPTLNVDFVNSEHEAYTSQKSETVTMSSSVVVLGAKRSNLGPPRDVGKRDCFVAPGGRSSQ